MEDAVTVDGIEFANARASARLVRGDEGRARAAEEVEHDAAAAGNILDRVGDHRHRLDGRMQSKLRLPARFQGVRAAILPDIRAIAAVLAQLETVEVRRAAILEGEDQLMPRAIEGAHAAIVLDPND